MFFSSAEHFRGHCRLPRNVNNGADFCRQMAEQNGDCRQCERKYSTGSCQECVVCIKIQIYNIYIWNNHKLGEVQEMFLNKYKSKNYVKFIKLLIIRMICFSSKCIFYKHFWKEYKNSTKIHGWSKIWARFWIAFNSRDIYILICTDWAPIRGRLTLEVGYIFD